MRNFSVGLFYCPLVEDPKCRGPSIIPPVVGPPNLQGSANTKRFREMQALSKSKSHSDATAELLQKDRPYDGHNHALV